MSRKTIRILLAEDNAADARLIDLLLNEASACEYRLVHTDSLRQTLEGLAAEDTFDAVLLDLRLADSHGLETFLAVAAAAPELPVVILSGCSEEDLALAAVARGAQDYLVKGSLDGEALQRTVRYAIERNRLLISLRRMALLDPLTGLFNRRGFEMLAEQQLRLADRRGAGTCLLLIDIDRMKEINDHFGHAAGDQALRAVADILRGTFRNTDVVGRIGGDEFMVLCVDADPSAIRTERLSMRLQDQVRTWNRSADTFRLSLSVGLADCDSARPSTLEALYRLADQRMYRHKQRHVESGERCRIPSFS